MTTRFLLIATAITAGLMASPARAQTDDRKLKSAAENTAFVMACPKHWERLPPRTQRLVVSMGEAVARSYSKDVLRQATLEAYAEGYDKQGERWCARMESILHSAGNF